MLRVNLTRGDYGIWKDTIIVTYRAVSPLQPPVREDAVVQFQGRHRGKTKYKTVLGATLELPLVDACLLWDENDSLRFPPPPGCPAAASTGTDDVRDLSSLRWEDMSTADKSRYLRWCRANDDACQRSTAIWYVEKCTSEVFRSVRAQFQCP